MAVSALRTITIVYSGDVVGSESIQATANSTSPGAISVIALTTNTNTVSVPSGTTFSVKAMTIVPPSANVQTITLKSTAGDDGFSISPSQPSSIAFGTVAPTEIILHAGGVIDGLRIFWT